MAKSLCSCLYLFIVIAKLHAMDEKMFTAFSLESEDGFYMYKILFKS